MRALVPRLLTASALFSALLLAGCSSEAPEAPPVAAPAEPIAVVSTDRSELPFTILVGAGTPFAGGNVPPPGATRGGPFDVPANASLLVVDAEWSCSSGPACELAIVVYDDDGEVVEYVEGTGPAHLEVTNPEEGEWAVAVFSGVQGSAVLQAEGTIHVAVTHT